MKTKTIFFSICALLIISSVQAEIVNGREYQFIDGVWYQIDRESGTSYLVDTTVITAKFKDNVSQEEIEQFNERNGVIMLRTNYGGYSDLLLPPEGDPVEYCYLYDGSDLVELVEPNTIGEYIQQQCIPNDPLLNQQWALHNTGQTGGTIDADIDAPEAWCLETGNASVIIGILDSGSDWTHEDLGLGFDPYQNIYLNPGEDEWIDPNDPTTGNGIDDDGNGFIDDWKGWDFFNNNNDSRGPYFHGTHVAGIAAAKTSNERGIAGVAGGWAGPGSQMMIVGVGDFFPSGAILDDAIYYAALNGAKIITMSLTVGQSQAIDDAIDFARNTMGVLVDCAAGNTGGPVQYPAKAPYVLAVGASDHNDQKPSWGSYGPRLNIAAPGENILSTTLGNGYVNASGTSMAAPHIAGVAALVRSANPNLTVGQVEDILQQTAGKVGGYNYNWDPTLPGHSQEFGYGRTNVYQAVLFALAYANKSADANATYSNSARHLAKGAGYLHQVFASGGEIFYRRSADGGSTWDIAERVSDGNGGNGNACITSYRWIPSEGPQQDLLHLVWERQIGADEFEVWYSRSNATSINWSNPVILPSAVVHTGTYKPGAMPVISYLPSQERLVAVYCAEDGLYYRISYDHGNTWIIPGNEQIFSTDRSVRYPSLSHGNNFLSLVYWLGNIDGVYSRIFDGSNWSSETLVADITGTWYNRTPSVTVDPEGNVLTAWRGQIFDGTLDPYYSILFRYGYSDNTWSEWFVVFEHEEEKTYFSPSLTYYNKGGINPYGIDIVYGTTAEDIKLLQYDIGDLWDDSFIASSGKWPNISEENATSGAPIFHWTDQDGPPYLVLLSGAGEEALSPLLASNRENPNPQFTHRGNGTLIHKRRAVIGHQPSGASLILDVSPIMVSRSAGEESILPFKAHQIRQPLNVSLQNIGDYLGTDTLSVPADFQSLHWQWSLSVAAGQDSSGNTHPNVFGGNYQVLLHIRDVNNPNLSQTANIANVSQLTVNLQNFGARSVVISDESTHRQPGLWRRRCLFTRERCSAKSGSAFRLKRRLNSESLCAQAELSESV